MKTISLVMIFFIMIVVQSTSVRCEGCTDFIEQSIPSENNISNLIKFTYTIFLKQTSLSSFNKGNDEVILLFLSKNNEEVARINDGPWDGSDQIVINIPNLFVLDYLLLGPINNRLIIGDFECNFVGPWVDVIVSTHDFKCPNYILTVKGTTKTYINLSARLSKDQKWQVVDSYFYNNPPNIEKVELSDKKNSYCCDNFCHDLNFYFRGKNNEI